MKFELKRLSRNCSNDEIKAEIRRVDSIVNKEVLTAHDFDKHAKISSSGIKKRLGSWREALSVAGLESKYSGRTVSTKMRQQTKSMTDEEILNELKRIAQKMNKDYITQEDINNNSEIISASTVAYRFGFKNGVEKAGLKVSEMYRRKYSEDELFENLLNVWTHYGRQPNYSEMKFEPSMVSPKTYENRYGTWRKALEAFVNKVNQGEEKSNEQENIQQVATAINTEVEKQSIKVEERRGINLGLRYKVLKRDNFKCVKCGASPATEPTCKLHIDHIIPSSKCGRTILDNLQTLCEKYNLGKGNRFLD